ncbi:hypothetical protein C8J56DRAFT_939480, partial [Mycena floridula]
PAGSAAFSLAAPKRAVTFTRCGGAVLVPSSNPSGTAFSSWPFCNLRRPKSSCATQFSLLYFAAPRSSLLHMANANGLDQRKRSSCELHVRMAISPQILSDGMHYRTIHLVLDSSERWSQLRFSGTEVAIADWLPFLVRLNKYCSFSNPQSLELGSVKRYMDFGEEFDRDFFSRAYNLQNLSPLLPQLAYFELACWHEQLDTLMTVLESRYRVSPLVFIIVRGSKLLSDKTLTRARALREAGLLNEHSMYWNR